MLLTILIPTFNRAVDLDRNISSLALFCRKNEYKETFSIIVSDNASSDNTQQIVEKHFQRGDVRIDYYRHSANIGFELNLLYALSKATSEWVMLLGDDDFLMEEYLRTCIKVVRKNKALGCITPNYSAFLPNNQSSFFTREENDNVIYYRAGFEACLKNIWRAHQMSGLCFKRQTVYEEYMKRGVHNLYPQIFFIGYSCLKYDSLHIGKYPVHVTVISQEQKDWDYGDDGLVGDVFDNFKHLYLSWKERASLEYSFMQKNTGRYLMYANNNDRRLVNSAIEKIILGRNTSFPGAYYISKIIIHDGVYTGKKLKPWFFVVALFTLLRQLFSNKSIHV
jgi:glycosyltransferase involved in cell wall biosynthesis